METGKITGPQLVIDREKCFANIDNMYNRVTGNRITFRPHFKTHQSIMIGRWFREYGVDRITVSSLKMAYYFAGDGWDDILVGIAYNPREYGLYEKLAGRCKLSLTISCPEAARILSEQCRVPLGVMIKVDTGYDRTGVKWNDIPALKSTISYLSMNKHIAVRGFMTHDGSSYGLNKKSEITDNYNSSVEKLNSCRDSSGLDGVIISAGDTPSASVADDFKGIDELRPGNFVFYDLMQYSIGSCSFREIAIALLAPVIDIRSGSGTIVIHGGAVHLSKDSLKTGGRVVYGMLAELDESGWHMPDEKIYLTSLSQEHGIIKPGRAKHAYNFKPGDLLPVIPVHSCLTADCMGGYMLDNGKMIDHMRGRPQDPAFSPV